MKISLSYATLVKLGFRKGEISFSLPTIYAMIGERCDNNCKFCSQSKSFKGSNENFLSRITWEEVSLNSFIHALKQSDNKIQRICLQVVSENNFEKELPQIIKEILNINHNYKISVSIASTNYEFLKNLFTLGIDTITIPLDCAKEETYKKIKGDDFNDRVTILCKLSKTNPFRVNTHLIYGLFDTEENFYEIMNFLKLNSISTGIFAFTPLKGTELEKLKPPSINSYRRVQVLRSLIYSKIPFKVVFSKGGEVSKLHICDKENFNELLKSGAPFLTSGCKSCTRPYYNDSPSSSHLYNYHRPISIDEINACIYEALTGIQLNFI